MPPLEASTQTGAPAHDFTLTATDGRPWTLADFAGAKALLLVFTCNHCPYALAVEERLIAIAREFAPQGLRMALICSNDAEKYPEDSFVNMQRRAAEKVYPFPYLHDETQQVARAYGAVCTPDPFLFDAELKLVYHGRVDDHWTDPAAVTKHELRDAIAAVLAGKQPAPAKPAMGCGIKWK